MEQATTQDLLPLQLQRLLNELLAAPTMGMSGEDLGPWMRRIEAKLNAQISLLQLIEHSESIEAKNIIVPTASAQLAIDPLLRQLIERLNNDECFYFLDRERASALINRGEIDDGKLILFLPVQAQGKLWGTCIVVHDGPEPLDDVAIGTTSNLANACTAQLLFAEMRDELIKVERAFEAASQGLATSDGNSDRFGIVNRSFAETFGFEKSDLIGKPISTVLPANDEANVDAIVEQVRQNGRFTYEMQSRHRDGRELTLRVHASMVRDEAGNNLFRVAQVEDITEQKQALKALTDGEERQRLLLTRLPGIVWSIDTEYQVTSSTGAGLTRIGVAPDELIGLSLFEYLRTDDPEYKPVRMHKAALQGESNSYELEFAGRILQCRVEPLHSDDGEIIGVIGAAADITEAKETENAYRESEARFREIFESVPQCVKLLDADGGLLDMNSIGLGLIEADSMDQVRGACIYDVVAPEHRDRFIEASEAVFRGESRRLRFEIIGLKGTRRWMETQKAPLYAADGSVESLLAITQDVSVQVRAEAIREGRSRVLQLLALGADLPVVLDSLLQVVEEQIRGAHASIHLIDGTTYSRSMDAKQPAWSDYLAQVLEDHRTSEEIDLQTNDIHETRQLMLDDETGERPAHTTLTATIADTNRKTLGILSLTFADAIELDEYQKEWISQAASLSGIATERRMADSAIMESEARFRQLADNIHEVFFILDFDWSTAHYISPAFDSIWGQSPEPYLANPRLLLDTIHVEDRPVIAQRIRDRQAGKILGRTQVDFRVIRPDQEQRWVRVKITPIPAPEGELARLVGIVEDITASKETERDLRLTEFSVDSSSEAMFTISSTGQILHANRTACDRLGYSPDELMEMHVRDFDSAVGTREWSSHWTAIRDTSQLLESQHRTKSGDFIDVEIAATYLEFEGVEYCYWSARDISDRKRAERLVSMHNKVLHEVAAGKALTETLDHLCELIEEMVPGSLATLMLLDYDRVCLNLEAGPSVTGEVRDILTGLVPGEGVGSCAAAADTAKPVYVADTQLDSRWQDAREVAAHLNIRACWSYPIMADNGKVAGTIAISHFETKTPSPFHCRLLETASEVAGIALQRSTYEEALRLTQFSVDHNQTEIYWVLPSGRFAYVNHAACRSLGYTDEELVKRSVSDITPDVRESDWPKFWNRARQERSLSNTNFRHRRRDGSYYPISLSVSFIEYSGKEFLVASVQDVSERVAAEQKLQQHRDELAHVGRLATMGEMATGIAHELNQPLTAIANLAYATEKSLQQSKVDANHLRETTIRMRQQSIRAGDIVRRLRTFIKKADVHKESQDINEIVRESVSLLAPEFIKSQARSQLELGESLPTIQVDVVQTQQVLVNLITNALDAMADTRADDRIVLIRTEQVGDYLKVTVEDNGHGFQNNNVTEIFEGFFTTKEKGMGMGLAICRTIMEAHSGRLIALPREPQGAMFQALFPLNNVMANS